MRRNAERQRHELDLLCRSAAGLAPVAPAICRLVRQMVGADACGLFWFDAEGALEGMFHEYSDPQIQDLFLNEYERLFVGPDEINVTSIARGGPRWGQLLAPPDSYYRSNTFNLLVRASGHHYSCDLRVDVNGRARAVLLLFRAWPHGFNPDEVAVLSRVEPYLRRAITHCQLPDERARVVRVGHALLDEAGQRLLMVCPEGESLLRACTLVGQDIRLAGPMRVAPRFLRDLCMRWAHSDQPLQRMVLQIPDGLLHIAARRLQPPGMSKKARAQVLVTLELAVPWRLQAVQRVLALPLSPLQREIALYAGEGGLRRECEQAVGVSDAALKKHLKAIYQAAGVASWDELARTVGSAGRTGLA